MLHLNVRVDTDEHGRGRLRCCLAVGFEFGIEELVFLDELMIRIDSCASQFEVNISAVRCFSLPKQRPAQCVGFKKKSQPTKQENSVMSTQGGNRNHLGHRQATVSPVRCSSLDSTTSSAENQCPQHGGLTYEVRRDGALQVSQTPRHDPPWICEAASIRQRASVGNRTTRPHEAHNGIERDFPFDPEAYIR